MEGFGGLLLESGRVTLFIISITTTLNPIPPCFPEEYHVSTTKISKHVVVIVLSATVQMGAMIHTSKM